jgi:electron transport complex protein RnfB
MQTTEYLNYLYVISITGVLIFLFAGAIGILSRFVKKPNGISETINKLLPQSQCGQCGYPGCKPYANAIKNGDKINKCVPGGDEVMKKLSNLLSVPEIAVEAEEEVESIAIIRADECIGCTLCIQHCPVDAIAGMPKKLHSVLVDYCTGCKLCVDPCPVNCIDMVPATKVKHLNYNTKFINK